MNVLEFFIKSMGAGEAAAQVEGFSDGVTDLEKTIAGTRTTILGLDDDLRLFGTNVGSTNDLLNGMGISLPISPMQLFGKAIKAGADFMVDATLKTVDYDITMSNLAGKLGIATEEASRITQVFDDYGLTIDQVERAMEMAVKNGFKPSIDSLADLADELQDITDPNERAARAAEIFGRNWADIYPALMDGGTAIRSASDAIADSMIVTQEAADAALQWREQLDNLGDRWDGLVMTLGQKAVPVLADVLGGWDLLAEAHGKYFKQLQEGGNPTLIKFLELLREAKLRTYDLDGSTQDIAGSFDTERKNAKEAADATGELAEEEQEIEPALQRANAELDEQAALYVKADTAAGTYQEGVEEVRKALDELHLLMSGKLGDEIDDFNDRQGELKDRAAGVLEEIEKLKGQGYSDQSDRVMELKAKYEELQGQIKANADEHELATKRIMFDLLEQAAAMDGVISDKEMGALGTVAEQWGLIDGATRTAWESAMTFMQGLNDGLGMSNQQAADLIMMLQGLPVYHNYEFHVSVTGDPIPDAGLENEPTGAPAGAGTKTEEEVNGRMAAGGEFVVPPGYPNDDYTLGLTSGEYVTVTPAGEKPASGDTYNTTIKVVNNSREAVMLNNALIRERQLAGMNAFMGAE